LKAETSNCETRFTVARSPSALFARAAEAYLSRTGTDLKSVSSISAAKLFVSSTVMIFE
jgi:hypothetical protein